MTDITNSLTKTDFDVTLFLMRKFAVLVLLCAASALFSMSLKPKIILTGLIWLTGTDMFPVLVLETAQKEEYIFSEELLGKFRIYTDRVITIEAVTTEKTRTLADGSKTFTDTIITRARFLKAE